MNGCFQVEKHIRKNKLKLTFTDQLGKAVSVSQDEDSEISSKKEAKKLAFYLFWNMRATLSRFVANPIHSHSCLCFVGFLVSPCCAGFQKYDCPVFSFGIKHITFLAQACIVA